MKWGDIKPSAAQDKKWEENLDWGELKDGKYKQLRPVGPVSSAVRHWVTVIKSDGSKTKFPMTCGSYDPKTEQFIDNKCPACRAGIETNKFYFANFIDRELQENKPLKAKIKKAKKGKFRKVGDESWSPIKVFKIPVSCASQLKNIVALNKHKIRGKTVTCELSDPDYGCDVFIKYDSNESPSTAYDVQKGDHTPLTKEERNYQLFDVENAVSVDMAKQEADLIRLGYLRPSEALLLDEEQAKAARKKGKEKRKKSSETRSGRVINIEEDEEIEEEEEERTSKKRKKKAKKMKSKKDKKKNKKKKKAKAKKSKKPKCFGDYKGKIKCFDCKYRTECIKET